jgi:hypothetical protein
MACSKAKLLCIMLFSLTSCYSCILSPNISLSTLFSNILGQCLSFVFHTITTTTTTTTTGITPLTLEEPVLHLLLQFEFTDQAP